MEQAFRDYAGRTAYSFMGGATSVLPKPMHRAVSSVPHLQNLGLQRGDRVALMMPNAAVSGGRGGRTARGLCGGEREPAVYAARARAPAQDSGAKAIVIIENSPPRCRPALPIRPSKHVVLCAMGDRLGIPQGMLVNHVVRNVTAGAAFSCRAPCVSMTRWPGAVPPFSRWTRARTTLPCCSTRAAPRVLKGPYCCTVT